MKKMFLLLIIPLLCFQNPSVQLSGQTATTYKSFSENFRNPPAKARPYVYHWWLGGHVDTVRLKEEIIKMSRAGISGFTIFEIGTRDTAYIKQGPAFLGKESLEAIKIAIREAGKLGMEAGLNTASSWNAGGSWIPPEHAAKSIYCSRMTVSGETIRRKLPFPEISENDPWGKPRLIKYRTDGKPVFYREIAVLAIPADHKTSVIDTSLVLNISPYFNPETEILSWKAPAGNWEILRYVCSNSGENLVLPSKHSAGPIMDHYDRDATRFHFNYIIGKLESVLGELRNTALKSLYMASYEAKGFTWTITLPPEFRKINGYEVYKFLPALFTDTVFSPETSARFRSDFQRTLSELMINNFYKQSKEICNNKGLKNNSEAGGPGLPLHNVPVEPLKALGSLDIPRGEFWINHSIFNNEGIDILRVVKEVSAASHIYNRGVVEMEAFTTFQHWQESPADMKPTGDRAFCEGMNKAVVHGFTHNPSGTGYPGIVYLAGTHFNDKRVWWPKVKPFNDYLSRVSSILQEADFVADVLYYYGDSIPNYGGHKNSRFTVGPGYDYEIVNTEILKELTVSDNRIIMPRSGAHFRLMVLTGEKEMDPEVLIKLHELVQKGATIIGPKPKGLIANRIKQSMYEPEKLIDKLWEKSPQKMTSSGGKAVSIQEGKSPVQILSSMSVLPDFCYPGDEFHTLDYIHYAKDKLDFYFVRNTTGEWVSRNCSFRQQNKVPEIWDPVTGEIVAAALFCQEKDHITVPVTLAPFGSLFVVFKHGNAVPWNSIKGSREHPPLLDHTREGMVIWEEGVFELKGKKRSQAINNHIKVQPLEGAWELFFPAGWGAPERVIFPSLKSWTESADDGIRYFSGTVTYKKLFHYDIHSGAVEKQKIYLDLCNLSEIGEVWLNNQSLGIVWTKPFRFDITDILKPGENELVVEVANTWSNRLAGDAVTGEKFTRTNITSTNIDGLNKINVPWKEVPLIESGLLGPVNIYFVKVIN